jgi:hypothetical protein
MVLTPGPLGSVATVAAVSRRLVIAVVIGEIVVAAVGVII